MGSIEFFRDDYPIPPVISHCKQAVTADLNLLVGSFFSGGTPAGHAGYWEDDEVGKIIAEKPAID